MYQVKVQSCLRVSNLHSSMYHDWRRSGQSFERGFVCRAYFLSTFFGVLEGWDSHKVSGDYVAMEPQVLIVVVVVVVV